MDFVFDKLDSTNCAQCGGLVDVAGQPAFKTVTCPNCNAPMPVPGKLGTLLLLEEIGTGAAGIVYRALDATLHRHVAVKILKNEEGESSKKIVEATVAEARALAAINHPNVVHIHTIGMRHGQAYIVMELLLGSGKLNVMLKEGWVADERRGLEIAIDVAQGLGAAHDAGVMHRDVKPGNILFNGEGVAKVLDFSVVHASTGEGEKLVIGTPYYISPEAARGLEVDLRSDLYSLGATIFHLLTGRPVFEGETSRDVMRARLKQKAPDIRSLKPGISAKTAAVMARMLATRVEDRPATYDELIAELKDALQALIADQNAPQLSSELAGLHDALSGNAAPAVPVAMSKRSRSATAQAPKRKSISPALIGVAVAAGLALIVGVILVVAGGDEEQDKDKTTLASVDPRRQRVDPAPVTGSAEDDPSQVSPPDPPQTPTVDPPPPVEKEPEKKAPDPPPVPEPAPEPKAKPKPAPAKPPEVKPPPPAPQPSPQALFAQAFKAWETKVSAQLKQPATKWQVMQVNGVGSFRGATLTPQSDGSVLVSGKNEATEIFAVESSTLSIKHPDITAIRVEALPHDSLPGKGPGRGPGGNFVLSNVTALMRRKSEPNPQPSPSNVFIFGAADADYSQQDFPVHAAVDNDRQSGWATAPRLGQPNSALFIVKTVPEQATENDVILRIMLHHESPHAGHMLGHFRVSVTTDKNPSLPLELPPGIEAIVRSNKRTKDEEKELETYFRRVKIEGLEYVPSPLAAATPTPAGPPPPKLDAYDGVEVTKLPEQRLYDVKDDALVLIPRYSAWHYWASPEAPPANWTAANFVASGWQLDDASFGYAYDGLRTTLKDMKGGFTSVYLRAPFKIADPAKLEDVVLQGRFDDAVAVYLNGQLVHRSPNLTGTIASAKITTPTSRAVWGTLELKDAKKHLKAGINIIAIECHNADAGDLDFIVDPALIAIPMPEPRKPVANNKKGDWAAKNAKLFTDDEGLFIEGAKGVVLENTATKTDFEDRSYPVRVEVRMRVGASAQVKLEARSKPTNVKNSVTDGDTKAVAASSKVREIEFNVKVTGKLQALTLRLPDGESVVESIRVIARRDGKVLEHWDFTK